MDNAFLKTTVDHLSQGDMHWSAGFDYQHRSKIFDSRIKTPFLSEKAPKYVIKSAKLCGPRVSDSSPTPEYEGDFTKATKSHTKQETASILGDSSQRA